MTDKTGFVAVKPVRAYEAIVEQIEQAIATRQLNPGDRLPSERDLMGTFAVSRATVREALRVLESGGLVRSRPGDPRGPEILQASPATLHKAMNRLVRSGTIKLSELVEFRVMLEGASCTLAAEHRTPEQLEEMRAAVEAMESSIAGGSAVFSQADVDFHATVWEASHNQLMQICGDAARGALVDLVNDRIDSAPDSGAQMKLSLAHDYEIFNAIEAQDGARAGQLARTFVIEYYGEMIEHGDRNGLALLGDAKA
ncbi:FadR family transcriptional regulator [Salinibacterium sp. SWN139]|uniref:FadR/GntR family transcriptional regulator n=1 Tax=Salinibacterium sp. SWN139 TaxID=2792055 RepID=UPI0018CE4C6E|nr:FadR/GntR family transcriptional regulator [Salinibacterium sp. SWN139]MBH0054753.1 FadR family transcriptional regulator [Salinibacterium sp. SWN139]